MFKTTDPNFAEVHFNPNRRIIDVYRKYDKESAHLQMDLYKYPNGIKVFNVRLILNRKPNPNQKNPDVYTEHAMLDFNFKQVNRDDSFDEPGAHQNHIDSKYMPWIKKVASMFAEVNQDLF